MRYQHARVVLAACLAAAAAAAQGTFDGFKTVDNQTVGNKMVGTGDSLFGFPSLAKNNSLATSADDTAERQDRQGGQGEDPYTRPKLFQKHHGDFMNRRERYTPMLGFTGSWMPNASISGEDGHFDELGYGVDANLPWNVSTDGYLMFGGYYHARKYNFRGMGESGDRLTDETLHEAGIKLGFGAFLDEQGTVLLEMQTNPGIFSDLDGGAHHQDFDYPSFALLTFRPDENFFFKLGVRYNQVYEEAPWLPLLGFSWEISGGSPSGTGERTNSGWRLDVLLPERAEVSYWPTGSLGFMAGCEVSGAQYYMRSSIDTGKQRDYVQIQEIVGYGGMCYRVTNGLSLMGRAGVTLAGDYDLTNGTAGYDHAEGTLSRGLWCEFTLGFDF